MVKTLRFFGWIFVVLGVLSFFSNPLIGGGAFFHTDLVHNLLILVSGLVFLSVGYGRGGGARSTLKLFGWIYLILAVLGWILVDGTGTLLGIVEVNGADSWLHFILALVFLFAGMKGRKYPNSTASTPASGGDSSYMGGGEM